MLFGFHFFGSDNPFYDSFFIDQESSAEGSHIGTSIQLFSPHTPNSSTNFLSVSAISVKGRLFLSMNFWCDFSLSTLTPITS